MKDWNNIKRLIIPFGVLILIAAIISCAWLQSIELNEELFSTIERVLKIFAATSIVLGVYNFSLSRKKMDFSVMADCIKRYTAEFAGKLEKTTTDEIILKKYVDFVNEEMFYIQNDYLPDELKREWIDGIIDFLPLYNKEGKLLNKENCIEGIVTHNLYASFTRVKKACIVRDFNEADIYSKKEETKNEKRSKLIKEIIKNLEKYKY